MTRPRRSTMYISAIPLMIFSVLSVFSVVNPATAAEPIHLHPDNPHYFLFRGRPTILLTSGEHYGAVLNLDFDYLPYLDELKARGFNLTRTFCGSYREVPGSFGITENTLAPKRYCCPWVRSDEPGESDGGNKFDLKKWHAAHFDRLKDFISQAGKRGIVVELGLFCTIYNDQLWNANPMKASNNINDVGKVSRLEVYTMKEPALLEVQDALARKIVEELKDYDNVYYEVCNEPYFGAVTKEWSDHIITTILNAEASFPTKHLISQNISNGSKRIDTPNPSVSIFNFHYSTPPESVAMNYGLKRVIADDETGFRGKEDLPYRTEGWDFILAGGAVYSNLDYSFACSHPNGTAKVTTSPGGGGPELRKQLQILKQFIESFDFVEMTPNNSIIKGGLLIVPLSGNPPEAKATARALVKAGKAYAVSLRGGSQASLILDMPAGSYKAEWINTKTGQVEKAEDFDHGGGNKMLSSPAYSEDIALRVKRK